MKYWLGRFIVLGAIVTVLVVLVPGSMAAMNAPRYGMYAPLLIPFCAHLWFGAKWSRWIAP
jgi:hypothetical protein